MKHICLLVDELKLFVPILIAIAFGIWLGYCFGHSKDKDGNLL